MSRVALVNIVKKITELSQRDKADFVRMLEEALEGGGGDTSKFISVEPQDFTEAQQMQARKNQGLYYEQIAKSEANIELSQIIYGSEHYTWKNIGFYIQGTRDESYNIVPYTAPKSISDVHSFGWETSYSQSTPITDIDVVVGESAVLLSEGLYLLYGPGANIVDGPSNPSKNYQYCVVALEGNTENLTPGFYYPRYNEQGDIPDIVSVKYLAEETVLVPIPEKYLSEAKGVKYVPQELTEEQKMQARKNQDLYYELPSIERLETSPDQDIQIIDDTMSIGAQKVSDTPIDASYLIGKKFGYGQEGMEIEEIVITNDMIVSDVNYTRILVNASDPDFSPNWAIAIVPEDTTIGRYAFSKGIWLVQYVHWLEVPTTTIHHIEPKYIEQATEDGNMDVRKKLGLYYKEEGIIEKSYVRGEDYSGKKISDDTPDPTDIISLDGTPASELYVNWIEHGYTIAASENPSRDQEIVTVYTEDFDDVTKGIYFPEVMIFAYNDWVKELYWRGPGTIYHNIDHKYIKDMYYEEEGIERINRNNDGDLVTIDNSLSVAARKSSNEILDINSIVSFRAENFSYAIEEYTISPDMIISEVGYTAITIDTTRPTDKSSWAFIIVEDEVLIGDGYLSKGLWFVKAESIDYMANIVHQIPSKYVPATGIQTYDINIDWFDLDEVIRQGSGYPWNVDNPEEEYDKLCEALGNGKMIALNIGQGAYGYPGGKLLTGNYLPLNAQSEDGYISEIIFPVIDWVNYNPNTGTITGSASYIVGLKCGYGVESEEFKYEFVATAVV